MYRMLWRSYQVTEQFDIVTCGGWDFMTTRRKRAPWLSWLQRPTVTVWYATSEGREFETHWGSHFCSLDLDVWVGDIERVKLETWANYFSSQFFAFFLGRQVLEFDRASRTACRSGAVW
jgi:hypothetical protein